MRILQTTKPIPVKYLKSGKDNGSYDVVKLLWLPGRTTAVRRPDLAAAGLQRRGVASPLVAPPQPPRPVSQGTAPKVRQGTGLLVPSRKPKPAGPLVIARS